MPDPKKLTNISILLFILIMLFGLIQVVRNISVQQTLSIKVQALEVEKLIFQVENLLCAADGLQVLPDEVVLPLLNGLSEKVGQDVLLLNSAGERLLSSKQIEGAQGAGDSLPEESVKSNYTLYPFNSSDQFLAVRKMGGRYSRELLITIISMFTFAVLITLGVVGLRILIRNQRQIQNDLLKNGERLDLAISSAEDGIWDWTIKTNEVYYNDQWYRMAGYEPGEFPMDFGEWRKRVHKDDLSAVEGAIDHCLGGGADSFSSEFRFLNKSGESTWIRAKGKIVDFDDEGNPLRFIGTHSDIHALKTMEKELRKSSEMLRQIIDTIPQLIYWKDRVSVLAGCNRVFADAVGIKDPDDIIGKRDHELPSSEEETAEFLKWDKIVMERNRAEFNIREVQTGVDGSQMLLNTAKIPLHDGEGKVVGVLGSSEDITERVKMEEAIRNTSELLQEVLNTIPTLIFWKDRNSVYQGCNRNFALLAGFEEPEMVVGKTDFDLIFDRAVAERFRSWDERVVTSNEPVLHLLERLKDQEGKALIVDTCKIPLHDEKGQVVGILGTSDDVTERKRLEEMMVQSEKMLSVGGLAAGMAHEINNPLAGIIQTIDVLAARLDGRFDIPANRKAAEKAGVSLEAVRDFMSRRDIPRMLESIKEAGGRVDEIVGNMLSFARKSESQYSTHSVNEILENTLKLASTDYDLKKEYDFRKIELVRDYDEKLPPLPCEGSKIQQVFFNIIKNGAQAMHKAGTPAPRITLSTRCESDAGMARIEIRNNGPGMNEAVRRRVFEPFFTTKPVGEGTGLGLSVSYFIIAENHGGEMEVESSDDTGVSFIIRLPLERACEEDA